MMLYIRPEAKVDIEEAQCGMRSNVKAWGMNSSMKLKKLIKRSWKTPVYIL